MGRRAYRARRCAGRAVRAATLPPGASGLRPSEHRGQRVSVVHTLYLVLIDGANTVRILLTRIRFALLSLYFLAIDTFIGRVSQCVNVNFICRTLLRKYRLIIT